MNIENERKKNANGMVVPYPVYLFSLTITEMEIIIITIQYMMPQ